MSSSSQPLLQTHRIHGSSPSCPSRSPPKYKQISTICCHKTKAFLSSRYQHYLVLSLVACDLLGIFADILIELYQCDFSTASPRWNDIKNGLGIAGLVFSCLFMLELLLSVWVFGWRWVYLSSTCSRCFVLGLILSDIISYSGLVFDFPFASICNCVYMFYFYVLYSINLLSCSTHFSLSSYLPSWNTLTPPISSPLLFPPFLS